MPQTVVIDCRGHMLGRLASIFAKQLLYLVLRDQTGSGGRSSAGGGAPRSALGAFSRTLTITTLPTRLSATSSARLRTAEGRPGGGGQRVGGGAVFKSSNQRLAQEMNCRLTLRSRG